MPSLAVGAVLLHEHVPTERLCRVPDGQTCRVAIRQRQHSNSGRLRVACLKAESSGVLLYGTVSRLVTGEGRSALE